MSDPARIYLFCLVSKSRALTDTQKPIISKSCLIPQISTQVCKVPKTVITVRLTQEARVEQKAEDMVMIINNKKVYWIILVMYVSMTRTNPTSAIIPKQKQWKLLLHNINMMLKTLKVRRFFCHLYFWRQYHLKSHKQKIKQQWKNIIYNMAYSLNDQLSF